MPELKSFGPWSPVPVPPIPAEFEAKHVAHSVTMALNPSDVFARCFSWEDLRGTPPTRAPALDRAASCEDEARFADGSPLAGFGGDLLLTLWGAKDRDSLVVLADGTAMLCPAGAALPEFAGFTPGPEAAGLPYRIPIHRFHQGASDGRRLLSAAQESFDAFVGQNPPLAAGVRRALSLLTLAGYPRPGTPSADADVLALWRREGPGGVFEWLGLVDCRCFRGLPGRLGVLVAAWSPKRDLSWPTMKQLADFGREHFRSDFLMPRLAAVRVVGGAHWASSATGAQTSSAPAAPPGEPEPQERPPSVPDPPAPSLGLGEAARPTLQ